MWPSEYKLQLLYRGESSTTSSITDTTAIFPSSTKFTFTDPYQLRDDSAGYRSSSAGEPVASDVQKLRHLSQNAIIKNIILDTNLTVYAVKQRIQGSVLSLARMDDTNNGIWTSSRSKGHFKLCSRYEIRTSLKDAPKLLFQFRTLTIIIGETGSQSVDPCSSMTLLVGRKLSVGCGHMEVIDLREAVWHDGIRTSAPHSSMVSPMNLRKLDFTQCGLTDRWRCCVRADARCIACSRLELWSNPRAPTAASLRVELQHRIDTADTVDISDYSSLKKIPRWEDASWILF